MGRRRGQKSQTAAKLVLNFCKQGTNSSKVVSKSYKVYSFSHKEVSNPCKVHSYCCKLVSKSYKVYSYSHKEVSNPCKVYSYCCKLVSKSYKVYSYSHKKMSNPCKVYSYCCKVVSKSSKIYPYCCKIILKSYNKIYPYFRKQVSNACKVCCVLLQGCIKPLRKLSRFLRRNMSRCLELPLGGVAVVWQSETRATWWVFSLQMHILPSNADNIMTCHCHDAWRHVMTCHAWHDTSWCITYHTSWRITLHDG